MRRSRPATSCAAAGRRRVHRRREPGDLGTDRVAGDVRARPRAGGPERPCARRRRRGRDDGDAARKGKPAPTSSVPDVPLDRQKVLDLGAHDFVDLGNDALEDVGGVDLVSTSSAATSRTCRSADSPRRNPRLHRRPDLRAARGRPGESTSWSSLVAAQLGEDPRSVCVTADCGRTSETVAALDDAVAALDPTERLQGKTIIRCGLSSM